jgi:Predicted dehydrogenases and related proteins
MKTFRIIAVMFIAAFGLLMKNESWAQGNEPLRLAVAGVAHGHLNDVISRVNRGDFKIVGVYEKDDRMREHNGLSKHVDKSLFFSDLGVMLDETNPEVVVDYGSIYDHLATVEACAPRGIHVMVEKPLAMNMKHARRMEKLAKENGILLLTNYETSWYDTNHEAYRMVNNGEIGDITRMMVYDGHQGPFEIRCGKDFTDWLTDPEKNGGGAIIDFGCYGANLATWLLDGRRPVSVYAVSNRQKPDKYSKVEDDATIIVQYPSMTLQLMPSWNWPMNRKDMHIYGSKGYIYQKNGKQMTLYNNGKEGNVVPARLKAPYNDSFYYLKGAVRGEIKVKPFDLASLENNMLVVEILDAAIKSAKNGKPVKF